MITSRTDIIKHLIKKFSYTSYLEIGVKYGENFSLIECPIKHGVDPAKNYQGLTHHMTSDDFFANHCDRKYDIVFIDGHHDSDYVCRDLNNSLKALNQNGTIVMHDCCGEKKEWSVKMKYVTPNLIAWNGDGFKVIHAAVKNNSHDLSSCVVDVDHGVGIIRKNTDASIEVIYDDNYDFDTMKANPQKEVNLISVQQFIDRFVLMN